MKAKKTDFQINRINPGTNAGFNLLFVLLAACAILPVVLVFMISISSEESIRQVGYSFFPVEFSSKAYQFLWNERDTILNALLIFRGRHLHRHAAGPVRYHGHGLRPVPAQLQAEAVLHLGHLHPHAFQRRSGGQPTWSTPTFWGCATPSGC